MPDAATCSSKPEEQKRSASLGAAPATAPAASQRPCTEAAPCPEAASEPSGSEQAYGVARLREVLAVLRSDLSSEEKLVAIKRGHDRWLALGSSMEDAPDPGAPQGAQNQRTRRCLHQLQDMKPLGPILELPKGGCASRGWNGTLASRLGAV